jgi:hypothetical protein
MTNRRAAALACAPLLLLALACSAIDSSKPTLPVRIDDATFWRLFTDLSEQGGAFRSENLVSNERTFPAVMPEVAGRASPGAAYIGVGPEQNFSYLAALKPRVAFIVDIRRENAALHLLYKSIFELSPTRAEFLSRLFSRPLSKHLGPTSSANDLMEAAAIATPSQDLFTVNLAEVRAQLATRHRWPISNSDLAGLTHVYQAFVDAGPDIRYSMRSGRRGRPFPTYAELMTASDARGGAGSFLASEEAYRAVRDLQARNLVVPVVGDFSGPRALAGIGTWLRKHGLTVAVFYASNVEMYLFRGDGWKTFYGNLSSLPIDRRSVLVRSIFAGFGPGYPGGGSLGTGYGYPGGGFGYAGAGPGAPGPGVNGALWADPIGPLLADVTRGGIAGYRDLLARMK